MTVELYAAFLLASAVLLAIPGPTVLLVVSWALADGRRAALRAVPGVMAGDATALTLSSLGLGALLATSATLFTIVKLAGAAYLIWMGIGMWRAPSRPIAGVPAMAPPRAVLWKSFIVTALNPKSIVFFVAFLPQFVTPTAPVLPQMLILGTSFVAMAGINVAVYAILAGSARDAVRRPGVLRAVHRTGGTLMIGAGLWTALKRA